MPDPFLYQISIKVWSILKPLKCPFENNPNMLMLIDHFNIKRSKFHPTCATPHPLYPPNPHAHNQSSINQGMTF